MVYFVSGHRDLSQEEFDKVYKPELEKIPKMDNNARFVIGDYWGVDEMAQNFLAEKGLGREVTVYHMFDQPRVCVSDKFLKKGGFMGDEERDAAMTRDSSIDVAFVRPGKRNSGTAQNIVRRYEIQFLAKEKKNKRVDLI